ncbi:MAG: Cna B-type domain-containing protein, partial [Firmicutes bacterium]|nr:Cna B-type domain-containing protein [Bacillota bacterium]
STGSVDISSLQTYRNKGAVTQGSKRVEATAELRFYPIVNKLDANASGDDRITEHEYYDVDGELCWLIQIQLPADTADAVTVTEALPAGITLQQLRMEIDGTSVASDFTWTGQQATCIAGSHTVTAAKSGQTVTVVLDPAFVSDYKSHRIDLLVGASVDDLPADGAVDVYTNTVTVTEGDQELGSCSQTQKITTNPYHEAITKTASTPDDNTVTYSLAINPQARDLLPGSDSLILTDELKYYNHANDPKLIMLQPGSLKVYERNADGTKGDELPSGTATYTYSTRSASNYSYNTLVITLPDEVAMIVEYTYLLSADSAGGVSLENTASLEGISGGDGQSANSIEAEIVDSVAGADLNGAIIYKHDSRDMGIGLEGAEFDLYKYDQNTNDYHEKVNTEPLVTDSTGMVTVSDLAYNLAYKLVETASPEGYIRDGSPYYFLLRDMRDQTVYKPSNFKGDELLDGALIYRPNVSENTSVTVEKQWQDENGNQVNKTGSIQFELWRTVQPAGAILPTKTLTVDLNKYSQPLYDFSGTYPQDTVLQFKVIEPNVYRKVPEGMTVPSGWSVYELDQIAPLSNMTKVTTYEQTGSGQSLYTFTTTFTITLDSDTMVEMAANKYFGDNKNQFGGTVVPVSVVSTPTPPETDDPYDEYVDTYTVAASNSWRCTVNDLPTKGTVSGEAVVYTYFVKEVGTVAGATPSYSNNSGITEGTIVITNTLSEEDSFVLPQTGGIGTTIFYALGGLLMAGAVILLVTKKKMSAEDDEA